MTNQDIMQIAMEQSARDLNCRAEDFMRHENVIVKSHIGPEARRYYKEPVPCNLVSYGNNIVASVKDEYREIVEAYIGHYTFYHCFETPNMLVLDEALRKAGQRVCFMAEYFLPDIDLLKPLECPADCSTMWQIGVDVLPDFRRKGIASALTGRLALEIIARGKVPFYCAAWSNLRSARNAVKSGFFPAWVEMTAKPQEIVEDMNK